MNRESLKEELFSLANSNFQDESDVRDESVDELMQLIDSFVAEKEKAARIEEAKHKYVNLVLDDVDEFKWRQYVDDRIAELQNEREGNTIKTIVLPATKYEQADPLESDDFVTDADEQEGKRES